ncbi:hypothetical protein EB796_004282 [Bugula neritina]|uniref:C2H2-type domain-containing protein n=1 Tax=Bugula neritina TaxID=10212 RepID=A0A7J7KIJ0_BUGNE|nr:hypothetical protein EB796_004282 [Bugula neritina]
MFKKIKIFGRDSSSASQSGSTSSTSNSAANGYSPSKDSNNSTSIDKQSDAEGFLCPTCMQSFNDAELLQQHFTTAHAEPIPQATADRELELLKMQLTASEESRTLCKV